MRYWIVKDLNVKFHNVMYKNVWCIRIECEVLECEILESEVLEKEALACEILACEMLESEVLGCDVLECKVSEWSIRMLSDRMWISRMWCITMWCITMWSIRIWSIRPLHILGHGKTKWCGQLPSSTPFLPRQFWTLFGTHLIRLGRHQSYIGHREEFRHCCGMNQGQCLGSSGSLVAMMPPADLVIMGHVYQFGGYW